MSAIGTPPPSDSNVESNPPPPLDSAAAKKQALLQKLAELKAKKQESLSLKESGQNTISEGSVEASEAQAKIQESSSVYADSVVVADLGDAQKQEGDAKYVAGDSNFKDGTKQADKGDIQILHGVSEVASQAVSVSSQERKVLGEAKEISEAAEAKIFKETGVKFNLRDCEILGKDTSKPNSSDVTVLKKITSGEGVAIRHKQTGALFFFKGTELEKLHSDNPDHIFLIADPDNPNVLRRAVRFGRPISQETAALINRAFVANNLALRILSDIQKREKEKLENHKKEQERLQEEIKIRNLRDFTAKKIEQSSKKEASITQVFQNAEENIARLKKEMSKILLEGQEVHSREMRRTQKKIDESIRVNINIRQDVKTDEKRESEKKESTVKDGLKTAAAKQYQYVTTQSIAGGTEMEKITQNSTSILDVKKMSSTTVDSDKASTVSSNHKVDPSAHYIDFLRF